MIIGLDVGGTHTDAVLMGAEGLVRSIKVATDPDKLFETVMGALGELTKGQNKGAINRLVLSTTLATNMVVQKKLPPVAMLVSGGPGIDPELFRIGEHYFKVQGGLDHSGRQIEPPDEKQVREIGEQIQALGIQYAGVVSKFSVRNPDHELRMAEILSPYVERVFVGHRLSGSLNFPRRITTTYLNAAVYPVHAGFFKAVQQSLQAQGISVPIRILKPDGGSMNFEASLEYPGLTILSGPSASVMGAISAAPKEKNCLILDIGGTTTDMAIMLGDAPVISPQGIEIGPYKTQIRALMTRSIGIGGDSVVRIRDGQLSVGPDRSGVAMAYGGPEPTPTDAFCVLGMTDSGNRDQAKEGLAPIARQLNISVKETAELIFDTVCRQILLAAGDMVEEINSRPVYTVHEMYEGAQIQPNHLLVLGGPAHQFATRLATLFDGEVSPVPHWQVANAIGSALARTTCEVTVFADTARKILTAQGEEYNEKMKPGFDLDDAREIAAELVRKKAVERGAYVDYLQVEIVEESEFNMVREFYTTGKNIRVRAQVKPGIVHGYDPETGRLNRADL